MTSYLAIPDVKFNVFSAQFSYYVLYFNVLYFVSRKQTYGLVGTVLNQEDYPFVLSKFLEELVSFVNECL